MKNKEKNFISAVIYVHDSEKSLKSFLKMLYQTLDTTFEKYEIICVNDFSNDDSIKIIKEFGDSIEDTVVSIINMSYYQGLESSMNAGVDLAIGDFVYEFDSSVYNYDDSVVIEVYERSLQGFDIVTASPSKGMKITSRFFYKIFNRYSTNLKNLETESFRIISRRGINRVHAMSKTIPYRKAVYAGCGLKSSSIRFDVVEGTECPKRDDFRWNTALDALILFTDIGYRIALYLTFIMMLATLLSGIYALYVFLNAAPIAGWTTTMLLLSFSFFGLFAVSAIIIKYLSIIMKLSFHKQKYVIEGIEKITK